MMDADQTSLESLSPQLSGALGRLFGTASQEYRVARALFSELATSGGTLETDFERAPGVSYNPRIARVPLIVMKDAGEDRLAPILSAMILSWEAGPAVGSLPADAVSRNEVPDLEELLEYARGTAEQLRRTPEDRTMLQAAPLFAPACSAVLAQQLDRARHLHLAAPARLKEVLLPFLDETRLLIELGESAGNPITGKLSHWLERVAPRLDALVRS